MNLNKTRELLHFIRKIDYFFDIAFKISIIISIKDILTKID